jgi:hypothetical protein
LPASMASFLYSKSLARDDADALHRAKPQKGT